MSQATWPPPRLNESRPFSLQAKALSAFYDLVTSHFHLSDPFGGPLDHLASPFFNKSFCLIRARDHRRFIYTIQPKGFLTAEPGERARRVKGENGTGGDDRKGKGVSLGRKGGGDVKSEPRGAVMIGAVLARPACAMLCVCWTTGFSKKGPHSAGFTQMLASAPHSSRLWQRAGERRGATTGKRDRNLISHH